MSASTRHEWTDDDGVHYVEYHDAKGCLHRKDGPASTWTWPDGARCEEWWEDGKFVRKERTPAPTREEWTDVGIHHVGYHDAERRLHRKDGPAVTDTWPDGYQHEAWHWHDKRHRKDGPAVTATLPDGSRREEWWEDGKFIRREWIPAPKDSDEANVASTWKQERDEAEKAIDLLERFNRSCGADRISVEHEIGTFVAKRTLAKLRKHFRGDA